MCKVYLDFRGGKNEFLGTFEDEKKAREFIAKYLVKVKEFFENMQGPVGVRNRTLKDMDIILKCKQVQTWNCFELFKMRGLI